MFEIIGKLGAGGMADVFLARGVQTSLLGLVALKRMRLSLVDNPEFAMQFRREAEIGQLLDHPHIVKLRASGQDEQGPWLALELVEGSPASSLGALAVRRQQQIPAGHVMVMVHDIAAAVAYAHGFVTPGGAGVLHRDISPDNLLVGYDGVCKLNDFGIARLGSHTHLTSTGVVRGKLPYLAPELFAGERPSFASDVFALGATLFKLWSGLAAFRGANEAELVRNIMFVRPPSLSDLRGDVDSRVAGWIERALGQEAAQRPTAAELLASVPVPTAEQRLALGEWVTSVSPREKPRPLATPANASAPPPPARPSRLRLPMVAVLAAVLGAAAMTLGVRQSKSLATTPPPESIGLRESTTAQLPATPEPGGTSPAPRNPEPLEVALAEEAPAAAVADVEPRPAPSSVSLARAPKPAPRVRKGLIDVRVNPFADVFVDGELVGTTPIKPLELSAGPHKILLSNAELKAHRSYRIVVKPEVRTRLEADLTQAP